MLINPTLLDVALRDAGVPIDGCDSTGTIWFQSTATSSQKKQAAKILADHVANPPTPPASLPEELFHPKTMADVIRAIAGDSDALKRLKPLADKFPPAP